MASPSGLLSNLSTNSERSYVSRGGLKLRGALDAFGVSVEGKICLDVGSSTGGFTDCLLQAGAASVWAIDVGWGLLGYALRKNPKVHVLERTNFRYLETARLEESPALATVDVAFISLEKILPKLYEVLKPGGEALALVKPQFEAKPKQAPKGVVKDETVRQAILKKCQELAEKVGFQWKATADAVIIGPKGNKEAFMYLVKPGL